MPKTAEFNIDEETIRMVGLTPSDQPINAQIAPEARVFKYPGLDDVYIMESDLYGNTMPPHSCFLAFYGNHGIIGKHLTVEVLRTASAQEIKLMTEAHAHG